MNNSKDMLKNINLIIFDYDGGQVQIELRVLVATSVWQYSINDGGWVTLTDTAGNFQHLSLPISFAAGALTVGVDINNTTRLAPTSLGTSLGNMENIYLRVRPDTGNILYLCSFGSSLINSSYSKNGNYVLHTTNLTFGFIGGQKINQAVIKSRGI